MAARRGLKLNVLSNLGGYAVSIVIAFVISPIIIQSLGDTKYGSWALVGQLINELYLSVFAARQKVHGLLANFFRAGKKIFFPVGKKIADFFVKFGH